MSKRTNKQNHLRSVPPPVKFGPDDSLDMPGVHKVEGDTNAMAVWIVNESQFDLTFVSELEKYYPRVKEAPDFKQKVLKPGERCLFPHQYFDIQPHDKPRRVRAEPAKPGEADFLYPIVSAPADQNSPA